MMGPHRLTGRDKALVIAGILLFIVVVSVADYFTPHNYTFSVFFIIPVVVSTWLLGKWEGVVISVISVAALVAAHLLPVNATSGAWYHLWNAFTQLVVLLTVTYILAALRRSNEQEAALARNDPLTGISNRRAFTELSEYEIRRAERFRLPLSLLYMDIDNFKEVNDTHGHDAGDDLLKAVAAVLRENTRSVDTAARLGGDEFAVIFPSAGYREAHDAVQRIRSKLLMLGEEKGWRAGFSIGAITCERLACPLDQMLKAADELMYEVKRSGKNGFRHVVLKEQEQKPFEEMRKEEAEKK